MRLGLRLFFGFFVVTGLTAFVLLRVFLGEVKPSVREVMEDVMVDTANLVAELVQDDLAAMPAGGDLRDSRSAARLHDYTQRSVDAPIWGLHKRSLDLRIAMPFQAYTAVAGALALAAVAALPRLAEIAP